MSEHIQQVEIPKLKHGNYAILPKYISKYSERAQPQHQWALSLVDKQHYEGMSKILDLGCRDGVASLELAKKYPGTHIIGLDNSIQMLEIANESLARLSIQNLEFSYLDSMAYFAPETFDAIYSSSYFHWIADKLKLLKTLKRSLKPGGKVSLSFFADHQKKRFDECISAVASDAKWSIYFEEFRPAIKEVKAFQFAAQVFKSGLLLQRLEFVEVHDIFESKLQMIDWLTTWCLHLKYLPEELHYLFLSEAIDQHLLTFPPDSKGRIHRIDYLLETDLIKG